MEQMNMEKEERDNINKDYSQSNYGNKKKRNILWIIPAILIIAIIAIFSIGYMHYTNPEQFYKRMIDSVFDSYAKQANEIDYETYKETLKLDAELTTEEELIDKEILELINNLNIVVGTQIHRAENQLVVDLQSDYKDEKILDVQVFADTANNETYLYAKDFINKYLRVDIEDEEYTDLKELYAANIGTPGQKYNIEIGSKIFKRELKNIIKSEYCSAEKESIKINEKDVNTTKNTIKMTLQQLSDGMVTTFDNLKENEEFLNIIKDEYRDDMIEVLENGKEEIKDSIVGNEDLIIEMNIYTTGIKQEIVKIEISVFDNNEEESVMLDFVKKEDKKYSFKMLIDQEPLITGIASINDNNVTVELELKIEEVGCLKINIEGKQEYNVEINKVDKNNVANIDELTENEQVTIITNLQKSKLYELIEKFSNYTNAENDEIYPLIDSEEDEVNDNEILEQPRVTSQLEENQILDYDDESLVTFGIPEGYTTDRISDNFQTLEKNDISIEISTEYSTTTEYYDSLIETKEYFSNMENCSNVVLSDMKTTRVGDITFYLTELSYDYIVGEFKSTISVAHIWAQISDKYVIEYVIENIDEITNDELKELLTLKIDN